MFVRRLEEYRGSDKEMVVEREGSGVRSIRILTRDDECGFSISDVRITGDWTMNLHYKNHVEANFIVSGHAKVEDLTLNKSWEVGPGMLYMVGPKDRHRLTSRGDVYLISVFNPPIIGTERHDAEGSFGPTGEIPPAWLGEAGHTMYVVGEEDARLLTLLGGGHRAYRYINRKDDFGLTISVPTASAGADAVLWYKNHVEANYIIEGKAMVEDITTNEKWDLEPGSLYVVGPRDRHRLKAETDIRLMSIFNPALTGDEAHDADGSYPPTGDVPTAWRA